MSTCGAKFNTEKFVSNSIDREIVTVECERMAGHTIGGHATREDYEHNNAQSADESERICIERERICIERDETERRIANALEALVTLARSRSL
jgi:hypothetical protein